MHLGALGYGRRLGIWLQGCTLACLGCCSKDTWAAGLRYETDWSNFAGLLDYALTGERLDGVTISGGEPFQQQDALVATLREIRSIQARLIAEWDIVLFTGYPFEEIAHNNAVLGQIDLLVAGPYVQALPMAPMRGSKNQTLHHLSELGNARYSDLWLEGPGQAARMDVALAGNDLVFAGLPTVGDLPRIEQALSNRGVSSRGASWHERRAEVSSRWQKDAQTGQRSFDPRRRGRSGLG